MSAKRARTWLSTIIVFTNAACIAAVEPGDEHGELGDTSQALWAGKNTAFVPNGRIAVCFNPVYGVERTDDEGNLVKDADGDVIVDWYAESQNDPAIVEYTTLIRREVEAAYESVSNANIDFTGWDFCDNPLSGTFKGGIRVNINTTGNGNFAFRHCSPSDRVVSRKSECTSASGYTATKEMTIYSTVYGYGYASEATAAAYLHEFGHALGFEHELVRDDSTDVKVAYASCVEGDGGTSLGDFFTSYDSASIMNATYCHEEPALSARDRLGLSIVYPASFTHIPAGSNGQFYLSGTRVLVQEGAQLKHGWLAAGAPSSVIPGGIHWDLDGVATTGYSVGPLAKGIYEVAGDFSDFDGRPHELEAEVLVDSSAFAAMIAAII